MLYILAVMMLAGIVGGFAGHLAAPPPEAANEPGNQSAPSSFADVVIGVVAAFCVPIFLQITQSNLMDSLWKGLQNGGMPFLDLLYLGGFCLIAAFSSRAFLQSVSAGVLRQLQQKQKVQEAKTEKLAEKQRALIDSQEDLTDNVAEIGAAIDTPVSPVQLPPAVDLVVGVKNIDAAQPEDAMKQDALVSTRDKLSNADKRVLRALANERYTRRSMSGVSKDAELSKSVTGASLERLIEAELVSEGKSKRTQSLLYQLTLRGRQLATFIGNG